MDLQELEKYRPIPRGGLFLLAGVALSALACARIGFLLEENTTAMWAWMSAGGSFSVMLIVCAFVFGIGDYLRRNVRAYNAWHWRKEDDEQIIQVAVTPRGKEEGRDLEFPPRCPIIKVPLGGWFNSSGGVYWCGANGKVSRVQGWTVKRPPRDKSDIDFPRVTLEDQEGQSITLYLGVALDFFEYYFTAGASAFEWSGKIGRMIEDIARFRRERDEARDQLKDAIAQIVGTIDHLDATKRFIKSKQAQEIRRGLVCELERILPPDDQRREKYGLPTTMGCRTDSQPAAEAQAGG